ncbi:MAG: hypothetical protein ACR2PJ_08220 [Pseudomonadales bacterium]
MLTFEATLQTTEGANRVALPPNTHLVREQAIVPAGTEVTDGDYHPLDDSGHGRFEVAYTQAEVGMNVYMRCCYANSRGERGPMSDAAVEIITD